MIGLFSFRTVSPFSNPTPTKMQMEVCLAVLSNQSVSRGGKFSLASPFLNSAPTRARQILCFVLPPFLTPLGITVSQICHWESVKENDWHRRTYLNNISFIHSFNKTIGGIQWARHCTKPRLQKKKGILTASLSLNYLESTLHIIVKGNEPLWERGLYSVWGQESISSKMLFQMTLEE